MRLRDDGKYFVWNYWDPAGPWDYKPDGSTKHWVGVHPNGGYYGIDVEGIVAAYEHGLVFTKEDIDRLIATNRDFMWNQQVQGATVPADRRRPARQALGRTRPASSGPPLAPYDADAAQGLRGQPQPRQLGRPGGTPRWIATRRAKRP